MFVASPETLLIGLAGAVALVVAALVAIAATIDRHASVAELKVETHRLRRARSRGGR